MNSKINFSLLYLASLWRLIRWPNLLMIFFTQCIVFAFIVKKQDIFGLVPPASFFILSLGTVLIAAAGYIINDYYDIKIDLVNKPQRIEIGRYISRRQALLLHTLFNVCAILLGYTLSWRVAGFFIGCAFVLWLYSNYLKRQPLTGNLTVSLLTAATIWIISLYFKGNDRLIYAYSFFAFLLSMLREIIKDMEDVRGDAAYGCKTLPILWGHRKTKMILYVLVLLLVAKLLEFAFTASTGSTVSFLYFLILPVAWLVYKIARADKQRDYAYLSTFCKWIMLFGVISLGLA